MNDPDSSLRISLALLVRDNPAAQAEWARAFPWLLGAAKRGVLKGYGSCSEADAEDLAKDAIVQVIQKFRAGDICHAGEGFDDLLKITHQTAWCRAVDAYRKVVRRKTDLTGEPIEPNTSANYAPIPVNQTKYSLEDILEAVNSLPPPQPEMFLARFLDGLTLDELATRFGKSYSNISQLFCRMTRTLRERLTTQESTT